MWGRSREIRGSTTLEGVLVLPFLLIILVMAVQGLTGLHRFVLGSLDMTAALRQTSLNWVTRESGLYWDAAGIVAGSPDALGRIEALQQATLSHTRDRVLDIQYHLDHPPAGDVLVQGTASRDMVRAGSLGARLSLTQTSRRFLPAMNLRQLAFFNDEILPALGDSLGEWVPGDPESDDSGARNGQVFIVDDSEKAHDYLKVFHTHSDCRYVRNKQPLVTTREDAIASGFRPCLVCLRTQIADN